MSRDYSSYHQRGTLKKIINLSMFWMAFLSKLIPKKNGLYVFGSMNGFDVVDNAKYKYLACRGKEKYFLTFNKDLINSEKYRAFNLVYCYSIKGMLLQLRAQKSFYTHGIFDLLPCLIWGSEKHNLWHGVPLKEIGPLSDWKSDSKFVFKLKFYFYRLFPHTYYMSCDYVYCPFEDRRNDYERMFAIPKPIIQIEGQARNIIRNKVGGKNKILYAPTHRSMYFNNFDFDNFFKDVGLYDKELRDWLKSNGYELVVRPHPIDKRYYECSKLSDMYTIDSSADIYETLSEYDLIITDFSSIKLDCVERGQVCLIVAPDIDLYMNKVGSSDLIISRYADTKFLVIKDALEHFTKAKSEINGFAR